MSKDPIAPIAVTEDRYSGTYIRCHLDRRGRFTAWHCEPDQIPDAPFGDDTAASNFWAWVRDVGYVVGIGDTEEEAADDLRQSIAKRRDYDPASQPRYLGNWRP